MKLSSLPQIKRNAGRFEKILRILAKYGLAEWLRESDPEFIQRFVRSGEGENLAGKSRAERFRMALADLGTTFIKLGQMLSTRADLVGEEVARELARLQTGTPADKPSAVRELIEAELGQPVEELFAEFDEEPLASASIAQVHAAKLEDGTEVVVKVQHAGIEQEVINDLDLLAAIASLAEKYNRDLRLYQPVLVVSQFRRQLLRELDFGREEQNLLQFQRNFAEDERVHIPAPFPERSARRVLTMERLDGIGVEQTAKLDEQGYDREALARRGVNLFLEMIFRDRFFHADPHPGNLLALPGNVIGLLDCGMVGYLDDVTKEGVEGIIEGFLARDSGLLMDYALKMGEAPNDLDRDELQTRLEMMVQDHLSGSLKELELSKALGDLVEAIHHHRIVLKPGISRLLRVLIMLEGTGRLLCPDFNFAETLAPFYRKLTKRRLSPKNVLHRIRRSYRDWDELLRTLPRDLSDLLKQARKGTLDVHLQHRRLDLVVNRLAWAILTAALFLGSTQLWSRQIPPLVWNTSLPGALGTLVAAYLAFRLLRTIHRSGGMDRRED